MGKFIRNLFMTVLAVCCFTSLASVTEAATVAILPLVTNIERAEDANSSYYSNAIQCIRNSEGYSLVDSDELTAAVDKNFEQDKVPTAEQMKAIASQAGVDIVVAMQLDVLNSKETYGFNDSFITLDLQGYCYSYNVLTGKFAKHRIFDDTRADVAANARGDFEMENWGRNVKREMNKILGVKKIRIERPRMAKF